MQKAARRSWTLGAVFTLHVLLVGLLLWGLAVLHAQAPQTPPPIELLTLPPPERTPQPFTRTHLPAPPALILAVPSPDDWIANVPQYAAPSGETGSGTAIDWDAEAKHQVNLYTRRNAALPAQRHASPVYRHRLDTPHHAGDVVKLDATTVKVYVSEFCFQVEAEPATAGSAARITAPIRCESAPPADYKRAPVETTTEEPVGQRR
jgi:hypothetical protein